jgi:hypothetical protein
MDCPESDLARELLIVGILTSESVDCYVSLVEEDSKHVDVQHFVVCKPFSH